MANWDAIRQEWENTKITLAELAEKHGVKLGTMKSRKSREKWSRDSPKVATKTKKDATAKKKVATPKQNKETREEPVIENDDLTDKQRLFCIYYIKYFNATKAYQKAYNVDYFSAMSAGSRLLRNVKVSEEIDRLKAEQANGLKLDARDVLQKYIDIAFADITDFVEFGREKVQDPETGLEFEVNKVKFKESSDVDGTLITEIKQGKDGASVKLADKMKALEFLAKYTDLLSESERKRLQDEKLKMDIEKSKAEISKLNKKDEKQVRIIIEDDIHE